MAPLQSPGRSDWIRGGENDDELLDTGDNQDNLEGSLPPNFVGFIRWLIARITEEYDDLIQRGIAHALLLNFCYAYVENYDNGFHEDLRTSLEGGDIGNIDFLLQELQSSLPEGVELAIPKQPVNVEESSDSETDADNESDNEDRFINQNNF